MKKIFLTFLIVSVLATILALGAFAQGYESDEFASTVNTIEGINQPSVIGTSERVVILGNDSLYYTYPAYYVFGDNSNLTAIQNKALNVALGYDENMSANDLKSKLVRVEIPNGVTYIYDNFFMSHANLKYCKMSDTITGTGAKTFQNSKKLEEVILSNNLKFISNDFCKGCSSLSAPLVIPASVTEMRGYAFDGCNMLTTVINYAENVKSIASNFLSGCPITEFNFPDNLKEIGAYAFNGAAFTTIELPNSITSLGSGVFQGCKKLEGTIVLPESLVQIPHDSFKQSSNVNIVVPKGCTSVWGRYSLQGTGIQTIYFTGTPDSDFVASVQANASGYVKNIVYANHCEYYYSNEHIDNGNECVNICNRCGLVEAKENAVHNNDVTITYTSYSLDGTKSTVCKNEGCEYNVVVAAPALFVCRGYSVFEVGNGGLVLGFVLNREAIGEYEETMNVEISYGVFAASANIGENEAVDTNGATVNGALGYDLTKYANKVIEIKVTGFDEDAKKNAAVVLGAYVITRDEEQTTVFYLQAIEPTDNAKYSTITFNTAK